MIDLYDKKEGKVGMKYFDEVKSVHIEDIDFVAKEIKKGKIAVFPTETVYGIGTNAFDESACKKIYKIKNRPDSKPLIVLVSNREMLLNVIEGINEIEERLIKTFWPGPLTIIFKKKKDSKLPNIVTAGKDTVGVRMTNGKVAHMLIEYAKVPIVAPSANLTGMPSGTKIDNIIKDLGDKIDYIIDCGDIDDDTTSTLVEVRDDVIYILRQGKIKKEELEKIAKTE